MKKALIFGVTGQDGSYLTDLLIEKGYEVIGVSRRTSLPNDERIRHNLNHPRFKLVKGDVTDPMCVQRLIMGNMPLRMGDPYEIYNLAAQSHVGVSFEEPSHTTQVTYLGCLNILESIRTTKLSDHVKFYQASSSEMFGSAYSPDFGFPLTEGPVTESVWLRPEGKVWRNDYKEDLNKVGIQGEWTQMMPNSPYAIAKLAAHHACRMYRDAYGVFACSGILFNHESERRGLEFVTRKIARYTGKFAKYYSQVYKHWNMNEFLNTDIGLLKLGNLEARRDWGHAEDYVRGMWLMLQQEKPDDYVLATGETHSVKEFLEESFKTVNVSTEIMNQVVSLDKSLLRPSDVPFLRGDASKAKRVLGWEPTIRFAELVKRMVLYEVSSAKGGI